MKEGAAERQQSEACTNQTRPPQLTKLNHHAKAKTDNSATTRHNDIHKGQRIQKYFVVAINSHQRLRRQQKLLTHQPANDQQTSEPTSHPSSNQPRSNERTNERTTKPTTKRPTTNDQRRIDETTNNEQRTNGTTTNDKRPTTKRQKRS
mgnify:CR=1 FL=1